MGYDFLVKSPLAAATIALPAIAAVLGPRFPGVWSRRDARTGKLIDTSEDFERRTGIRPPETIGADCPWGEENGLLLLDLIKHPGEIHTVSVPGGPIPVWVVWSVLGGDGTIILPGVPVPTDALAA